MPSDVVLLSPHLTTTLPFAPPPCPVLFCRQGGHKPGRKHAADKQGQASAPVPDLLDPSPDPSPEGKRATRAQKKKPATKTQGDAAPSAQDAAAAPSLKRTRSTEGEQAGAEVAPEPEAEVAPPAKKAKGKGKTAKEETQG